jgi:hypothetical protein
MSGNIKVGEIGRRIYFAANYDMSGASSVSAKLTKPSGVEITVVPTVQGVAFGSYLANQYATYDTQAGDIDEAGTWSACLTYNDSTPKTYHSDDDTFVVDAGC